MTFDHVPLVALLDLVHLRVTLAVFVLGGAGRCNEGGIDYGAGLEHEALCAEFVVDDLQDARAQAVFFQQVAKAQDAHPVGDSVGAAQAAEVTVERHLKQGFFGCQVGETKPLLKAVDAQHHLDSKGGRPVLATGAYAAVSATSSTHGITNAISSSSISLRVRRVLSLRPRSCCFFMQMKLAICVPLSDRMAGSFEHDP